MNERGDIPVLELRRLLYQLNDLRPDILVRFRLIGEMWQPSFLQIVKLSEHGVILRSVADNKLHAIKDLNYVMQFEIDSSFQVYQPHYHYPITPFTHNESYATSGS